MIAARLVLSSLSRETAALDSGCDKFRSLKPRIEAGCVEHLNHTAADDLVPLEEVVAVAERGQIHMLDFTVWSPLDSMKVPSYNKSLPSLTSSKRALHCSSLLLFFPPPPL